MDQPKPPTPDEIRAGLAAVPPTEKEAAPPSFLAPLVWDRHPAYLALLDAQHQVLAANRRFREVFPGESAGFCHLGRRPGQACESCRVARVLASGRAEEWNLRLADGRSFWLWDQPVETADGARQVLEVGLETTGRDSRRHPQELGRAEPSPGRGRERLLWLETIAPGGEGIPHWGAAWTEVCGLAPAALPRDPKAWLAAIHPEDRPAVARTLDEFLANGTESEVEFRLARAEGGERWGEACLAVARDGEGRVSHRIILARDMTGRKLFEQELVESHQELRSIFHALPDSYFRLDADGRYLDYKPGLGTAPPFGLGDPLGRLPTEVFPGPTGERIMAALELVRAGRGSQALEYALTSGGQERFFEARLAPMGQRQAVCLVREITKYKLAALAVGEREANYRALVDSLPLAVLIVQEGILAFASRGAVDLLGADSAWEVVGHPPLAFVVPAERMRFQEMLAAHQAGGPGAPDFFETTLRDASGWELACEVRLSRVGFDGAAAQQLVVTDVTERKRYLEELKRSERRYRALYQSSRDGFAALDLEWRITEFNTSFREMLGYDEMELYGKTGRELTPARWRVADQAVLQQVQAKGFSEIHEKEFLRKGGEAFPAEVRVYLLKDSEGRPQGYWLFARDISERRRQEREIKNLALFPDINPHPVLRITLAGEVTYLNRAARQNPDLGDCRVGRPVPGWLLEGRDPAELASGEEFEAQAGPRVYSVVAAPLPERVGIYLHAQDVSERLRLVRQHMLALQVFDNSIEGIVVADTEGRVQMVNPAYTAITGYPPSEVLGQYLNVLRSDRLDPKFTQELWEALTSRGQWRGEYWNRRKNGEAYPEWLTISIIRDEAGRPSNFLAIFYDITEIKRSQERIQYHAHHDALTGLPNRVLLNDRLAQALAHASRYGGKVGVMFLDLDNFKVVNDSLGHEIGDLLLKKVGLRLLDCVREEDTVARLGGDEFILVLGEVQGTAGLVRAAQRVLDSLASPVEVAGHHLLVGASIGVTIFPDDGQSPVALIKNADMAMYRAKELGRNNYQLFTAAMQKEATRRLSLETALRQGLERGEFEVHYQPKVRLGDGRVAGVEALVRWRRRGGLVLPEEFLGLCEESGLIVPLGEWVLEEACRQAHAWRQAGHPDLMVAVNLSPRQFLQPELPRLVDRVLAQTGLSPVGLELEITESTAMQNVDYAVPVLGELSQRGVRFSLDDFGTGYSSFYYLRRFPLNALKVDRSFVAELSGNQSGMAIVDAILAMARSLSLEVVAEGVETPAQLDFLRARRCPLAQGHLFSPPLPAEEFGRLLDRGRAFLPLAGEGGAAGSDLTAAEEGSVR